MPISFVPKPGQIVMCDYDMACVPPEMRKIRRAVIVSLRSYNARHGHRAGRAVLVPFSATPPKIPTPADIPFAAGVYRSLTVPTWAICSAVASLSHNRLDRVAAAKTFLSETLTDDDLERIRTGLRHVMGL